MRESDRMSTDELRAQVEASAARLAEHETTAPQTAAARAAAAAEHVALANALERQEWIDAQLSLGVPLEHIDADRGIVTNLPLGPVHVSHGEHIVTHAPESDTAHQIRVAPDRGLELSQGIKPNKAAHEPYEAA